MTKLATWLTMLALAGATGALFVGLRRFQLTRKPDPEVVRKLFHISGGTLALALPWLFDDVAPVLFMGLLLGGMFLAVRFVPRLRDGVGQVLLGVHRQSVGEFGFVASICVLFWLARGDKVLYSIPILMVALADALAALIGRSYGKFELHIRGDRKTIEGIVVFFLTAFLCVHIPVLLSEQTGRAESLLIAVNVAAMVMLAEAAAWWGLDNIIIPVWGYMVLKSLMPAGAAELVGDFVFLAGLTAFVYWWRHRTTLGDDALAGTVLWGYVCWSVGGITWFLPSLLQLVTYATLTARSPHDAVRTFRFPIVLANIAAAMAWLLVYRETRDATLFVPFATCFAANVAIIALVRLKFAHPDFSMRNTTATVTALGMVIVVPSMLLASGMTPATAAGIAAGLLAVASASLAFYRLQPHLTDMPVDYDRFLRQAWIVSAASLLAYALMVAELAALARWGAP